MYLFRIVDIQNFRGRSNDHYLFKSYLETLQKCCCAQHVTEFEKSEAQFNFAILQFGKVIICQQKFFEHYF